MVESKTKSRTYLRIKKKIASGRIVTHYRKPKPGHPSCGKCGNVLAGVPRARMIEFKRFPKSSRRPERPFGGVLCSRCMRLEIVSRARKIV